MRQPSGGIATRADARSRGLATPSHWSPGLLVPKLVTTLKTYNREQFVADMTAGIIVGIVSLPLAIAFAITSGLTPERGLYTAVIAGFIISALGGSQVQIVARRPSTQQPGLGNLGGSGLSGVLSR